MSALGQKRTCAVRKDMSALPPKADIGHSPCAALAIKKVRSCYGTGIRRLAQIVTGRVPQVAQKNSTSLLSFINKGKKRA